MSPKINLHFLKIIVHVIFFSCSYICAAHVLLAHFNKNCLENKDQTCWGVRTWCLPPSHSVFCRGAGRPGCRLRIDAGVEPFGEKSGRPGGVVSGPCPSQGLAPEWREGNGRLGVQHVVVTT